MNSSGIKLLAQRRSVLRGLGAGAAATGLGALGLAGLAGCSNRSALTFANWESYLGETTLDDFKQASGIDVSLRVIPNENALFDQIRSGAAVPDLMIASNRMVERLRQAGLLAPLSRARLPALRNLDRRFAQLSYDPGGRYAVPYTWLVYAIGYRKSAVKVPPASWADLFGNPAYAGRIALPADPADLYRIAARTIGKGPSALTAADLPALTALLTAQLPRIKQFHSDDGQDLLLDKAADLVAEFNGDLAQVMLEDPDLGFVLPNDGSELTCDSLCVPTGSANADGAHQLIDYLLTSQAGMRVLQTINYPTPNLAAKALMPPDYQTNPALFPDAALLAKCDFARWDPPLDLAIKTAWDAARQLR